MKKTILAFLFVLSFSPITQAKSVNLTFSPLLLLIGYIDAGLDIKVLNRVTIGPTLNSWNVDLDTFKWEVQGLGARANFYLTGPAISDSWYLSALGSNLTLKVTDSSGTGELNSTYAGGAIGYHWVWSTFNIQLGYKFVSLSNSTIEIKDTSGTITERKNAPGSVGGGGLEFNFGLAF